MMMLPMMLLLELPVVMESALLPLLLMVLLLLPVVPALLP
jgi:hypothetical protein